MQWTGVIAHRFANRRNKLIAVSKMYKLSRRRDPRNLKGKILVVMKDAFFLICVVSSPSTTCALAPEVKVTFRPLPTSTLHFVCLVQVQLAEDAKFSLSAAGGGC